MVPPHVHKHLTEHNCQDSDGLKEAKKLLQSHKIEHGQQGVHDPRAANVASMASTPVATPIETTCRAGIRTPVIGFNGCDSPSDSFGSSPGTAAAYVDLVPRRLPVDFERAHRDIFEQPKLVDEARRRPHPKEHFERVNLLVHIRERHGGVVEHKCDVRREVHGEFDLRDVVEAQEAQRDEIVPPVLQEGVALLLLSFIARLSEVAEHVVCSGCCFPLPQRGVHLGNLKHVEIILLHLLAAGRALEPVTLVRLPLAIHRIPCEVLIV
eukprot:5573019-Prymnesium_polylepis.2